MYAVVEIAGQQFKVEKDQKVYVNRLDGKEGSKVSFDNILMLDNSGKTTISAPDLSAWCQKSIILSEFPAKSPTVVLICAMAIFIYRSPKVSANALLRKPESKVSKST